MSNGKSELPALLASASRMWISVQSASQCSRQMWRKRACVRDTLFRSDKSATVCSHSFQPLNQSVRIPTWSRNIMAWGEWECAGGDLRGFVKFETGRVLPRTAGVRGSSFQQSRVPLRPDRGGPLTWFRCWRSCRHECCLGFFFLFFLRCLDGHCASAVAGNGSRRRSCVTSRHLCSI